MNVFPLTNAVKAAIISAVNAVLALLAAFGAGFSDAQNGAIIVAVNALLGLWVAVTYKNSPTRVPDDGFVFTPDKPQ
jgi:hypothetical protein